MTLILLPSFFGLYKKIAVAEIFYKVVRVCGQTSNFSGLSLKLDVLEKFLVELDSIKVCKTRHISNKVHRVHIMIFSC